MTVYGNCIDVIFSALYCTVQYLHLEKLEIRLIPFQSPPKGAATQRGTAALAAS